jgi:hypothetical protein
MVFAHILAPKEVVEQMIESISEKNVEYLQVFRISSRYPVMSPKEEPSSGDSDREHFLLAEKSLLEITPIERTV